MNQTSTTTRAIRAAASALIVALVMAGTLQTAQAGDFLFKPSATAKAFAFAPSFLDTQEDLHEEYEHEANDAWLGMPVHSADGRLVGFVADAWIGEDGSLEDLLVSLTEEQGGIAVYVDGHLASLDAIVVSVDLVATSFASLERDIHFELASR